MEAARRIARGRALLANLREQQRAYLSIRDLAKELNLALDGHLARLERSLERAEQFVRGSEAELRALVESALSEDPGRAAERILQKRTIAWVSSLLRSAGHHVAFAREIARFVVTGDSVDAERIRRSFVRQIQRELEN